jgi:hypothetical protein
LILGVISIGVFLGVVVDLVHFEVLFCFLFSWVHENKFVHWFTVEVVFFFINFFFVVEFKHSCSSIYLVRTASEKSSQVKVDFTALSVWTDTLPIQTGIP